MADISFHHGTRVFDSAETPVLIRTAQSAVVLLQGTAPDADASVFPIDQPVLMMGSANYSKAKALGKAGTLREGLDAILSQGNNELLGAYVYVTRSAEGASFGETLSNLVGDAASMTGVYAARKIGSRADRLPKPRIFAAPGFTGALAADGVNAINVPVKGGGYVTAPTVSITGGGGRGATAVAIVADGQVQAIAVTKPGFGYTGTPTVAMTGGGGEGATAEASIGAVGNPLAHEMEGLLAKLRAVAFLDGPNSTNEAAVITAGKYASDRLYICDPYLEVWDATINAYVPKPASARFAGVQCRVDRDIGFYKSVSNELIYGIDGTVRPIVYGEETDLLNAGYVGTVTNYGDGFRTWGNRTTSGMFLAVRRTRDFVNEAIERAYLKYVDRGLNDANLKLMVEGGRAFLKMLEDEGYVLRGSSDCWLDREKNSAPNLQDGILALNVMFESPPPIEDLRITSYGNQSAYTLLIDRVNGAIEFGNGTAR